MRIIARSTLKEFWESYPETEEVLKAWYADVKASDWSKPTDIKRQYTTASILKDSRAVFDIKGGNYRIIVRINYLAKIVFIRFVGTHEQYDKIDASEI